MIKLYNFDELRPEEILNRDIRAEKNVEDVVDGIIADVRARGDGALKDYALKFDGAAIENLQVTNLDFKSAHSTAQLKPELRVYEFGTGIFDAEHTKLKNDYIWNIDSARAKQEGIL